MQDKNNIADIDEQFTDLGWENMRSVLDAEMPVVPLHECMWSQFWPLILLPSLFVFGIMIYFGIGVWQDEKSYDNIEGINQPVADSVIENNNDTITFEENNETTNEVIIESEKQHSNDNIEPKEKAIISLKNVIQKDIKKDVSENNLHIIKENSLHIIKENNLHIIKENSYNRKNIDENVFFVENKVENSSVHPSTDDFSHRGQPSHLTAEVVSTNSSEKEPTKNVTPIVVPIENLTRNLSGSAKRISTLPLEKMSFNDLEVSELAAFYPIPQPRKLSQTYSLMTGVRGNEFTDFVGVNVGLLAHYRFMPKLGLETGLIYNKLWEIIYTNINYTNLITLQYPDNTRQFNRTVADALNFDYLRLPLAFTYRPHAKIQLAVGIDSGYRFTIRSTNTNDTFSFGVNSTDNDGSIVVINETYESSFTVDAGSIEFDASLVTNERIDVPYSFTVREWDFTAHAGLRYYPVRRLGIDLSYQYGLLNMTLNNSINRNSGVQLALVYQLHR